MGSTLMTGRDTEVISLEQLENLPVPQVLGVRHKPIPHFEMLNVLFTTLQRYNLKVTDQKYAIQKEGLKLFGTIDLVTTDGSLIPGEGRNLSLGLRHGNDKSMSLQIVAGNKVIVCDNMMLSGQAVVLKKKHTLRTNLKEQFDRSVSMLCEQFCMMNQKIVELQEEGLRGTKKAKEIIYDAFIGEKILPMRYMPSVDEWYFNPPVEATDCTPNTKYGLHNAFTRVITHEVNSAAIQRTSTQHLGRLFGI